MNISYDEAMSTVHVITREQKVIQGMDALAALYGQVRERHLSSSSLWP
jgi:hypothetical protein